MASTTKQPNQYWVSPKLLKLINACERGQTAYKQLFGGGVYYFHFAPGSCQTFALLAATAVSVPEGETPEDEAVREKFYLQMRHLEWLASRARLGQLPRTKRDLKAAVKAGKMFPKFDQS